MAHDFVLVAGWVVVLGRPIVARGDRQRQLPGRLEDERPVEGAPSFDGVPLMLARYAIIEAGP